MAPGEAVLTTEFKVNLLAPGSGEAVVARAHVVKAGRTLTVSLAEVFVLQGGRSCCS
jgi:acyl-coenzyme A thioesterase PaaI-like protein